MIEVSLVLLLGSSFARLRDSKVVSIFLLNTLLISFSLDSTLAANIPGNAQTLAKWTHRGEAIPYLHRDLDETGDREQRPDHERPVFLPAIGRGNGINPQDFDVSESREVVHRHFHESKEDREEKPQVPLGSLLRAVHAVIKESGLVLGLGENFIQDLIEGNPNAPSTQDLLNAAMRVANLPIFKFLKYALDALQQDLRNAIPINISGLTENDQPRTLD